MDFDPLSSTQQRSPAHGTIEDAVGDAKLKGGAMPFWCRSGIAAVAAIMVLSAVFAASNLARLPSQTAPPQQQPPLSAAAATTRIEFVTVSNSDVGTVSNSRTVHKIDISHGEHPSSPTALRPGDDKDKLDAEQQQQQPEVVMGNNGKTRAAPGFNFGKGELTFVALNDYTRRGDVVGVGYPWLEGRILVEPHRNTSLEVVDPVEGMHYYWSILETHNAEESLGEFKGHAVEVQFKIAPQYKVVLQETRAEDQGLSRTVTVDVYCKYVRRELRSLLPEEREEMFDAMKVRGVFCVRGVRGFCIVFLVVCSRSSRSRGRLYHAI